MGEPNHNKVKTFTKYLLQKLLGFHTYLYVFAHFVIIKIRWDSKEKDFFHFIDLLPDDGIILDLGANIGVTSYHLAVKRPKSIIYSFEPLPDNMKVLRRIKKRYKLNNIHEFQLALGDKNERLEMIMPVVDSVPMHGLSHVVHEEIGKDDTGLKFEVEMVMLDDFKQLTESDKKITGIKLDVENFESYVIKGAENLIKRDRPIIYSELWDNDNRKRCISFLNNLGYSTFILRGKRLEPYKMQKHSSDNFFFMPDSLTN